MSSTVPTTNISFSDIYNVYNDASAQGGTTHNGIDPISMSDLISATHPSTDTMALLTPGIDRKFNVIESPSYNIATETTPPRKVLLPSNGISVKFYDNNGPGGDYSNSQRNSITFESTGTSVFIKINSFNFEHSSSGTRMYDRLGIQASDDLTEFETLSANLNILKSPILSEALYQSVGSSYGSDDSIPIPATSSDSSIYYNSSNNGLGDGSGGFIFGNISSENDVKGRNFSSLLNTWLEIKCRFVHFYFYSDSSVVKSGWDMLVSSGQPTQIGDSGLVPIDWTAPSSGTGENIIQNNGSIILNSTTKNKLYTPVSKFTFSDGPNDLPKMYDSGYVVKDADGEITFDAGVGNHWKIELGTFEFWRSSNANLWGQLALKSTENLSDSFSNVSINGLINTYGQRTDGIENGTFNTRYDWGGNGYVIPGSNTLGISWGLSFFNPTIISNKRYLKFKYVNNIDSSTFNTGGPNIGWSFTLQVIDVDDNNYANDYSSGDAITTQEVNIKDDFMGRTKNYDPSMQIVEYVGGNYTTNILKNSLFGSGNLGIGLKMPIGAYDLTSSDITILNGNGETITGFSVADGATETNFSVTPPTGSKAYKLKIRVKGNTFYDSEKIWNKPADNDFCWYWNMPVITITSTSVNSGGTTGSQKIPITVSCQHRFDISKVLVQSGLKNATIDGNITILDGSKNATFDIIAVNPSSPSLTTPVILDISKSPYVEAIRELDSGYFYTSFTDITPFTYFYEPDITGPILVVFSFTSSNSTNSVAKAGDIITLVVDSNEQLNISSTSHSVEFIDSSSGVYSTLPATISYPSSTRMNGTFDIPNSSPSLPGGDIGVSEIIAFDLANNSGTVSTALKIKYYVDFQFTNTTFTRERGGAFTPNDYAPSGIDTYGVALTVGGPIPNNTNWESLSHNDVTELSYTATDPAGNTKTATLTVTTKDTIGPNVVISYDGTNNLGDKTITFSFTELPIGFDIGGITIEPPGLGATITNLTTSGLVRTALFSPSNLGIYELSVAVNVFNDAAGNGNLPSNKLKILLDTAGITPQTIQIGTGASTVSKAPFYGLYDYSQFGVIYLATDIHNETGTASGTAGIISSLFFEYAGWSTGYTALRQTVKISHTQAIQIERGGSGGSAVYPDYRNITLRDTTIVKRDFTFTNPRSERWEEIGGNTPGQSPGFTTNFEWNGTDNILISWENHDGSWASGYGYLRGGSVGNSQSAHSWYRDNYYPTSSSGYNLKSPNIRLVFS